MLTPAQIEARRHGIGSSDIAAVLGVHTYKAPLDVCLEKWGLAEPFAGNEATLWGDLLEPVIAAEYARRTGQNIARCEETLVHPKRPWMRCNPDRIIVGRSKGCEIKNRGLRQAHRYGPGKEDCAEEDICQASWCMAVADCDEWDVAALIGSFELRIYTIARDLELEALMVDAGDRFWHEHVLARRLPPVDGSDAFKRYLAERYPRDTRPLRRASAEEEELGEQLVTVRAELGQLMTREATLVNRLKASMETCGGIFWDPERRITWKSTTAGTRPFCPNF